MRSGRGEPFDGGDDRGSVDPGGAHELGGLPGDRHVANRELDHGRMVGILAEREIDLHANFNLIASGDIAEAGANRLSTQQMGDAVLNALEQGAAREKERA